MQQNNPYLLKEQLWKILSNNRGQLDTSFYKDTVLSSFFLFAVDKSKFSPKSPNKKNYWRTIFSFGKWGEDNPKF